MLTDGEPCRSATGTGRRHSRPLDEHQPTVRRVSAVAVLRFEPALGVDGGHAARAGGGDRLAVGVVLHVAAGEHARRCWCTSSRAAVIEVAVVVHVEEALEQVGVGPVADGDEQAGDRQRRRRRRSTTLRDDDALELVGRRRGRRRRVFQRNSIFGLANARSCMIFEARSSSRRWMSVTLSANLVRNVASSTAESPPPTTAISLAAEEEAVAGGARRQAVADQALPRPRGRASATGRRW